MHEARITHPASWTCSVRSHMTGARRPAMKWTRCGLVSSLPRSESGGATSCPALTGSLSTRGPLPHPAHDIHPRHMETFGDLYPVDVTLKCWGHTQAGLRLTPVSVQGITTALCSGDPYRIYWGIEPRSAAYKAGAFPTVLWLQP